MTSPALKLVEAQPQREERLARKKREQVLCAQLLQEQNQHYKNSAGISQNNAQAGFVPAFHNTRLGISVISRFADGSPAPVHILDGLPQSWVRAFDSEGRVSEVSPGVVAGFLLNNAFYTREEAARQH